MSGHGEEADLLAGARNLVRDLPPHPDGNLRFAHDLQVDDREIAAHWAAAASAATRNGLSLRRRGITSLANKVMLATVSAWSRKPPCPNNNRFPKPPTLSCSALIWL
jgi:hypothetical protein